MRNISSAGLAKLAEKHGTEPISIIEIDWVDNKTTSYADRTVGTIKGRVVEVGTLDAIVNVSGNSESQQLTVVLDDTDGSVKAIMDAHDVHKRPARVYQYFSGLDLTDKFLLFSGQLTSPIVWNERDRTVKVTILTQIEDLEIGFSAEEGDFPYLPAELVNQAWPVIFGTVINNPTVTVNKAISGTTLTPVGILAGGELMLSLPVSGDDYYFLLSLVRGNIELEHLQKVILAYQSVGDTGYEEYLNRYNDLLTELQDSVVEYNESRECTLLRRKKKIEEANANGLGNNPIKIHGGEDFPRGRITIEINGGLFTGSFSGDEFHISSRYSEALEEAAQAAYEEKFADTDVCGGTTDPEAEQGVWNHFRFESDVPCGTGDFSNRCKIVTEQWISMTLNESNVNLNTDSVIQQFWAEAGSTASLYDGGKRTYIVSVTPGRILAVRAYKEVSSGIRQLVDVPGCYYSASNVNYGAVTAIQLSVDQLSALPGEGWQDDIYVTFKSDIGPNIVDIIAYIIEEYTDLSCDETSFNYARTKLEKYPANFAIMDRKNVISVLQDIAFQSRCAIWFSGSVVYLRYLPEEPTPVDTITESDIDAENGVEVSLTTTEELVTKMIVKWSIRVEAEDEEYRICLRHNLKKYGTHEKTCDFYIFNQPDIIYKMATFWLMRKSNTWKRIKFTTPLHKLNLETFDAITLDFAQPYVADGPVLAVIESAEYNSNDNAIEFDCLVPVVAGSLMRYPYYWPAALPASVTWPPQSDIDAGYAGGGRIGTSAAGSLPIGDVSNILEGQTIFVGGPNVVFGPHSDWGDKTLTDEGFIAQDVITTASYSDFDVSPRVSLNTTIDYAEPMNPISSTPVSNRTLIDIHNTIIYDSSGSEIKQGYLSSLIKRINEDGKLVLDGDALIAADDVEKRFDFKYDEEGDKLGAGTAFLQDQKG